MESDNPQWVLFRVADPERYDHRILMNMRNQRYALPSIKPGQLIIQGCPVDVLGDIEQLALDLKAIRHGV